MNDSARIQWKRISIEAVAIVASILLAFAIDAWWEGRQDATRERSHLVSLQREFSTNLEMLTEIVSSNNVTKSASISLLEIITGRRDRPEAAVLVELVWEAFSVERYEPLTTAYENLVSTGDIALIRDEQLKIDIASFMTAVELYRRQDATLDQWKGVIQQFIGTDMVPLDWVVEDFRLEHGLPDPVGNTDWDSVLESREFEGILVNRAIAIHDNIRRLDAILPATQRINQRIAEVLGTGN